MKTSMYIYIYIIYEYDILRIYEDIFISRLNLSVSFFSLPLSVFVEKYTSYGISVYIYIYISKYTINESR